MSSRVPYRLPIGIYWGYGVPMEETPQDTEGHRVTRGGSPPRQNGAAIRAIREKDGWTQAALARAVKIKQGTLSGIEREVDNAGIAALNRIARKLRVPVGAIMRDRDDEAAEAEPEGAAAA